MQIDSLTPKNMLFNVNNSTFSRRGWKSGAGSYEVCRLKLFLCDFD
jgi:hypothetical protein